LFRAGALKYVVEEAACGADERAPGLILFAARRFADQHDLGRRLAVARHGQRPRLAQRTFRTDADLRRQYFESSSLRRFRHDQVPAVLARGGGAISGSVVTGMFRSTRNWLLTSVTPDTDSAMSSVRRFSSRLFTRPVIVTMQLFTITSTSLASTYASSVKRSFI